MEGVETALLAGVEGPGLATIQQCAEDAGLVHFHLAADGQHGVVPDPLSDTCYCTAAFPICLFSLVSRERLLEPT